MKGFNVVTENSESLAAFCAFCVLDNIDYVEDIISKMESYDKDYLKRSYSKQQLLSAVGNKIEKEYIEGDFNFEARKLFSDLLTFYKEGKVELLKK